MDLGFGLWQSHFVTTASSIKLLKHSSSTTFPYSIECTYCLVLCKVHQCKISQHITSLCCVCTIVLSESSFGQFLRCFPRLAKAEMVAVRGLCNLRTAFLPSLAMMKMLIKIMSMTLMMMATMTMIKKMAVMITMTMMMMIGSACAPLQHFARGNTFSLPPRPPHLLLRCFSDFSRSHQDHLYMRRFSEWDFSH